MLTDEQFDELADKLLKKIATQLGVDLEEENLSLTLLSGTETVRNTISNNVLSDLV